VAAVGAPASARRPPRELPGWLLLTQELHRRRRSSCVGKLTMTDSAGRQVGRPIRPAWPALCGEVALRHACTLLRRCSCFRRRLATATQRQLQRGIASKGRMASPSRGAKCHSVNAQSPLCDRCCMRDSLRPQPLPHGRPDGAVAVAADRSSCWAYSPRTPADSPSSPYYRGTALVSSSSYERGHEFS
jgi:hypothetical protein